MKITNEIKDEMQRLSSKKIVSLKEEKKIRDQEQKIIEKETKRFMEATGDPQYSFYMIMLSRLTDFVACTLEMPSPEITKVAKKLAKIEDEMMPGFPPMSPITNSYFNTWNFLDFQMNKDRETFAGCFYNALKGIKGADKFTLKAIQNLSNSKMEFFEQIDNPHPFNENKSHALPLRNIHTNEVIVLKNHSGYGGKIGQIWFIRVLPPIENSGYYTSIITPYVFPDTQQEKIVHFINSFSKKIKADEKYHELMKFGTKNTFWLNFIFEAYLNYESGVVYLRGTPDDALSRPHSEESYKLRGE